MRDYHITSPSLEGILSHSSIEYEGIERPLEVLHVLDGPSSRGSKVITTPEQHKILEEYFQDLYGTFLKKFSYFVVEGEYISEESLKLQAMLQEMIKVKKLMVMQ